MHTFKMSLLLFALITLASEVSTAACEGGAGFSEQLLLTYPDILLAKVVKFSANSSIELEVVKTYRGNSSGLLKWDLTKGRSEDDASPKRFELGRVYLLGTELNNLEKSKFSVSNCDYVVEKETALDTLESIGKYIPAPFSKEKNRTIRTESVKQALDLARRSRLKDFEKPKRPIATDK